MLLELQEENVVHVSVPLKRNRKASPRRKYKGSSKRNSSPTMLSTIVALALNPAKSIDNLFLEIPSKTATSNQKASAPGPQQGDTRFGAQDGPPRGDGRGGARGDAVNNLDNVPSKVGIILR